MRAPRSSSSLLPTLMAAVICLLTLFLTTNPAHAQSPIPISASPTYNITQVSTAALPALPTNITFRFIEGSNDNIDEVPLGFAFYFFGTPYSTLQVSSNGDIQFATQYALYSARPMPYNSLVVSPYLAYFYTDLYPMADTVKSWASYGTNPARVFVLRLQSAPYVSTALDTNTTAPPSVSLDVLFYESDWRIEVRYYSVDASAQTVNIGVEGPNITASDFAIFANQQVVNNDFRTRLAGSTLVFTYRTQPTVVRQPIATGTMSYEYTTGPVPTQIELVSPFVFTGLTDDQVYSRPIGFTFAYYGISYTTVGVSTNGNLQFSASTSSSYTPAAMPSGNGVLIPYIAFMYTDINPALSGGSISSATMGTAPDRFFVVRFSAVKWASSSTTGGDLTCDVILHETTNTIRFRYYRVMARTSNVVIGLQGSSSPRADGTYDFVPVLNLAQIGATNAFDGQEYVFTRVASVPVLPAVVPTTYAESIVAAPPAPTFGSDPANEASYTLPNGASFVIIRPPFAVNVFGTLYAALVVGVNGAITFTSNAPPTTPFAMPYTTRTSLPLIAAAFTSLTAPAAGRSFVQTQTTSTFPNRTFLVRLANLTYASNSSAGVSVDVRFSEQTGAITLTYNRLDRTNQTVLIGVQGSATRRSDYTYDFASPLNLGTISAPVSTSFVGRTVSFVPRSAIAAPVNYTAATFVPVSGGNMYNVSWTPSVAMPRLSLTSLNITSLPTGDDAVGTVWLLGMTFPFYGVNYTSIRVSTNGNIQFTTSSTSYSATALPTTVAIFPFLSPLWADLIVSGDMLGYQLIGTAPNRTFVLRYSSLTIRTVLTAVDIDVLLYESGEVEYRYYQMPTSGTNTVTIGLQGSSTQWTSLWNAAALSTNTAFYLSYSTVNIRPIPQPPVVVSSSAVPSSSVVPSSSAAAVVVPSSSAAAVVVPSSSAAAGIVPSSSMLPLASSSAAVRSSSAPPLASSVAPLASSVAPLASSVPPLASSVPLAPSSSAVRSSSAPLASSSAPLASTGSGDISSASSSSDLSNGAIAGVVIGVVVGVLLIIGLAILFRSRASKSSNSSARQGQSASRRSAADETSVDLEMVTVD